MRKALTSAANPRYKRLHRLAHSSRERGREGLVVLDGVHLAGAYRQQVGTLDEVAVSASATADPEITRLLPTLGAGEPLVVSDALFKRLSTVETPTGLLAVARMPRPVDAVIEGGDAVLLEDVQDPGNLGSILRSAAAAGFRRAYLSRGSAQAWSPRALRAGMGAHFVLDIHEHCELRDVAAVYRGKIIATSQRAAKSIYDADLSGATAFVFGNEGAGLSAAMRTAAHEMVRIPMAAGIESLNVAAAAAICFFERVRQRERCVEPNGRRRAVIHLPGETPCERSED